LESAAYSKTCEHLQESSNAGSRPATRLIDTLSVRIRANIRLHLVGVGDPVGPVEDVHHGDDLADRLVVQSEPLHGGAVGVDSVLAVVRDGHRQGDDLLGQKIELPGLHDRLEFLPRRL
jgi:hypothetical protein